MHASRARVNFQFGLGGLVTVVTVVFKNINFPNIPTKINKSTVVKLSTFSDNNIRHHSGQNVVDSRKKLFFTPIPTSKFPSHPYLRADKRRCVTRRSEQLSI